MQSYHCFQIGLHSFPAPGWGMSPELSHTIVQLIQFIQSRMIPVTKPSGQGYRKKLEGAYHDSDYTVM